MKSKFIVIFFFILAAVILGCSMRGKLGIPKVYDATWKENGPFELSPERGRYALTYAIVETKSVFLPTDMARFVLPDVGYHNGKYVSLFAPALSFVIIPGYILGKLFNAPQLGTYSMICIFALLNWSLIYLVVKKLDGNRFAGLLSSFSFLFATPAFAYGVNLYQHHVTTFLMLLSVFLILSEQTFLSTFSIMFMFGVGVALDYPNFFFLMPICISLLCTVCQFKKNEQIISIDIIWSKLFAFFGAILPMLFFFWFNAQSYGGPFRMLGGSAVQAVHDISKSGVPIFNKQIETKIKLQQTKEEGSGALSYFKSRNLINGLYIHIFSPDRGVLNFTPVILFGLLGMLYALKRKIHIAPLLMGIAAMNVILYSMWGDPWGGWAFGSRYLIPTYAILSIFIGILLTRFRNNIIFVIVFFIVCSYSLFINTSGALSSSANPPKTQVLTLEKLSGREEKFTFKRNIDYLQHATSKSFFYQSFLRSSITAWNYFVVITSLLIACSFLLSILMIIS